MWKIRESFEEESNLLCWERKFPIEIVKLINLGTELLFHSIYFYSSIFCFDCLL